MTDTALKPRTQDIEVDAFLPHAPAVIWKTLTTSELIGRWLMVPTGFEPVQGKHFTFQTTPSGAWDGVTGAVSKATGSLAPPGQHPHIT